MKERVMNLAEQLRAHATDGLGIISGAAEQFNGFPITKPLLAQAADTIESQSRLLALAETLAGAVADWWNSPEPVANTESRMIEAAEAITTALTEYQTTGTVPCKRCAEAEAELSKLLEYGFPPTGTVPCGECERLQSNLKQADHNHSLMYANLRRVEADNTDLRRQLAGLNSEFTNVLQSNERLRRQLGDIRVDRDGLKSLVDGQAMLLSQAQADNAALLGALRKVAHYFDIDSNVLLSAAIRDELTKPHPGAPLLEALETARKALEDVRGDYRDDDPQAEWIDKALDAIRNRENRHE